MNSFITSFNSRRKPTSKKEQTVKRNRKWVSGLVAFQATLLTLFIAQPAQASIAGSDNASDAAYLGGNYHGQNGGGGFLTAWVNTPTVNNGNAGMFIGNSNGNGGGGGPGINSASSKAWGIYANGNNTAQALRSFTGSLINGQSFSIDMDSGFDNNTSSGGFGLQNTSGGLNRFEFFHKAGQANYQINDSATGFNTGIPFTDGGLHIVFTLVAANTYNITITRLNGATVTTFTGRTLGGTSGTGIDRLRLFRFDDSGGGGSEDYYFNNISLNCNGGPSTIISGPASVCSGTQNTYNNTGSNGGTRRWAIQGNGSIVGAANGSSVQILAGAAGAYTVILTNSEAGCTNVQQASVTVKATPGTPAPSNNGPLCAGSTLNLFANTTADTYTWTGPAGFTSSQQNPTLANVTTAAGGTYNLVVSVNGCTSPMGSTTVTVNNAPTCLVSGTSASCPSATSTFTAPAGMSSYAWSVTGSGTINGAANGQSVNVDAGPGGSYTINVTITAAGCSSTCGKTVVIDGVAPTITCGAPALSNPSFEAGGGAGSQTFTSWNVFGNTFKENFIPRSGAFHAKMYGNFNGSPNFTGMYQDLAAAPGQVWRGEIYALFDSTDSPASGNQAKLRIEFLNSSFGLISGFDSPILTPSSPKDTYLRLVTTGTAPAGTAFVRIVPTYIQFNNSGGSVYFDDASLSRITTVSANGSCQGQIPDVTSLATASDNNPGVTVSQSPAVGTVVGLGDHTVNVIATDVCGNQSQCSLVVTVVDDTGPTITCPANVTVQCDAPTAPTNTGSATATDACSSPAGVSFSDSVTAGSCSQGSTITRTWSAVDQAGNLSTCTQIITIQDTTAPVISGVPGDATIECPSDIPASPGHRAWDLYANSGALSEAIRPFANPLAVGQQVVLDFDNGFIDNGSTVGFGLRNSLGENRFELFFVGGDAFYRVKGNGASVLTALGFTGEGLHVAVTLTGADSYMVRIVRLQDGSEQTLTGTLGGTAGTAIDRIRFFNFNAGSGAAFDAFYNNVSIPGVTFDSASSPAYDDGWQNGDNGGTGWAGGWQLNPTTDGATAGNLVNSSTGNDGGDSNNDNDIDSFTVTASDNCDPHVAITFSETDNGAAGCAGSPRVITRTWTAKDDCGNTSSQTQTLTQRDDQAPALSGVPANVNVQCVSAIPAAPSTPRAWGLYANSGAVSEALRSFSNSLAVGQTFIVDLDTGFEDAGATAGFGLQNALGENRFELFFVAGDAFYRVKGNGASVLTTIGYSGEGLHVEVTLTGADSYSVKIVRLQNNAAQTLTGTLGGTAGTAIDRVRLFNFTAGGGAQKDQYFNSISIPGSAADNASAAAYDDGWQNGDNGGTGFGPWTLQGSGGAEPATFGRFIGNSTANDGGDSNNDGDINSLSVTASDNCDPHVNVSFNQTDNGGAGCGSNPRIITRTWTASDDCGNTMVRTQTITQADTQGPALSGVPADTSVQCIGDVPAPATVTASDNCDAGATVSYSATTNGNVITRTWTSTDACGNATSASQTITISDTIAPVITCPANTTVECSSPTAPATTGTATATDNCDATPTITYADSTTPGSCPQAKTITRTWTATDDAGNSSTCVQTITTVDTTAPTITASIGSVNTLSNPSFESGNGPGGTFIQDWNTFGNVYHENFAPRTGAFHAKVYGTGANNPDFCGLFQDKPASPGQVWRASIYAMNPSTDAWAAGNQAKLRMEFFDSSNGFLGAQDSQILTSSTAFDTYILLSVTMAAPLNTDHVRIVPTYIQVNNGSGSVFFDDARLEAVQTSTSVQCAADVPAPDASLVLAQDNCDTAPAVVFLSDASNGGAGCPADPLVITRTFRATDACGNSADASVTITVADTIAPTLNGVPADATVECNAVPAPATVTASDNCDTNVTVTMTETQSAGSCPSGYTITRTWTATDDCGNSSSASQTITVQDTTAPTISANVLKNASYENGNGPGGTFIQDWGTFGNVYHENFVPRTGAFHAKVFGTGNNNPDFCGLFQDHAASAGQVWQATVYAMNPSSDAWAAGNQAKLRMEFFDASNGFLGAQDSTILTSSTPFDTYIQLSVTMTAPFNTDHVRIVPTYIQVNNGSGAVFFDDASLEVVHAYQCAADVPAPDTSTVLAQDTCDATPAVTHLSDVSNGGAGCPGNPLIITRTYRATDDCGNMADATVTITVSDTIAPTLAGVPASSTVECDSVPAAATVTATDNCDASPTVTLSETTAAGSCPGNYILTRTWTATDACGNSNSASQSITVHDTTAPVLSGQGANATIECPATPNFTAPTATDNCDANPTITVSNTIVAGSCSGSYTATRTWTATDDCGNSSSVSQTITVQDSTPPAIACPADSQLQCGDASDVAHTGLPTVTDNCTSNTRLSEVWVNEVHYDNNGADVGEAIEIAGTAGINLSGYKLYLYNGVASDRKTYATNSLSGIIDNEGCGYGALSFATAGIMNGNPDGFALVSPSGAVIQFLSYGGTFIAANGPANGMTSTDLGVTESTSSQIGHSLQLKNAGAGTTFTAFAGTWKWAGSSTNSFGSLNVGQTIASCATGSVGLLTYSDAATPAGCTGRAGIDRTWHATDVCGNSSSCTQHITYVDTTAPVLSGQGANATIQCPASPSFAAPTATDNCDANPTITFSDSTTAGSCAGSYTVTRTWTATDDCGNTSSVSQTITVVDTTAPTLSGVPADTTVQCDAVPAPATVTASDTCDATVAATFNESSASGSCPGAFTISRVWSATDACGNHVAATQTITVIDTTAPVLSGQGADASVECPATPSFTAPTATDNCDTNVSVTFTDSTTPGTCPAEYSVTRTWVAVDSCSNTSAPVSQTITVVDTTAPTLAGVPADTTAECDDVPLAATVTATDNCDSDINVGFLETTSPGSCGTGYTMTRVWTATDDCGNSVSATQTITVQDTAAPIVTASLSSNNVLLNASFEEGTAHGATSMPSWTNFGNGYQEAFEPRTGTNHAKAFGNFGTNVNFSGWYQDHPASAGQVWRASVYVMHPSADPWAPGNEAKVRIEFFDATNGFVGAADSYHLKSTTVQDTYVLLSVSMTAPAGAAYVRIVPTYMQLNIVTPNGAAYYDDASLELVQSSMDVQCAADVPAPDASLVIAQDNCDKFPTVAFVGDASNGGAGCAADPLVITRTFRGTDVCGNFADVSVTINVADTVAPTLVGVPADTTAECDDVPSAATVTATDNCDTNATVTMTETVAGGSCASGYTITRTWTATDDCGNSTSQSQTITVQDTSAPTLVGVPSNTTVQCDAVPSAANVTATDNCDTNVVVTFDESTAPGTCPGSYTISRTWIATDDCGNSSTQSQTITVIDTSAPVLSGQGANATIQCPATPSFTAPTASDNCDGNPTISFTDSTTAGSCAAAYSVTRTWVAVDSCSNTSAPVSQTITVVDTTNPTLVGVPTNTTAECDSVPAAATVTATDNCDTSVTVTESETTSPGSCASDYTITRTWTATDDCGNSSSASQTITVHDTTAPVLSGPGANATIQCPATPSFTAPTASDNCDGSPVISFTDSTTPGSCPAAYSVTRTWIAVDACGNTSAPVSQTISVVDTTQPSLAGVPSNTTVECNAVPGPATVTATDNCDTNVPVSYSESTTPGSCAGNYTLTRTWSATDDCGNARSASQVITVHDTTAPTLSGQGANATIQCPASPSFTAPTASDNCDANPSVTYTDSTTAGSCPGSYTKTRTWKATDNCGNQSAPVSQTITVVDTTAPTVTAPTNRTVTCGSGTAPAQTGAATASDGCDGAPTITYSDSVSSATCPKVITRTWTATDHCGNSVSKTQTITVIDNAAPVLGGVPTNVVILCGSAVPPPATVTATDACTTATLSYTQTVSAATCPKVITRTWVAVDQCGNAVSASQTITTVDTVAPSINCVSNTTVQCGPGATDPSHTGSATASDNCSTAIVTYADTIIPGPSNPPSCTLTIQQGVQNGFCYSFLYPAECTAVYKDSNAYYPAGSPSKHVAANGGVLTGTPSGNVITVSGTVTVENMPSMTLSGSLNFAVTNKGLIGILNYTMGSETGKFYFFQYTFNGGPANGLIGDKVRLFGNNWNNKTTTKQQFVNSGGTARGLNLGALLDINPGSAGSCGSSVVRRWTATDGCGNSSVCTQTITVIDTQAPVLSGCPVDLVIRPCDAIPPPATLTASDACQGSVPVTYVQTVVTNFDDSDEDESGHCGDPHVSNVLIVRTWSATDNCGNSADCTQVITIDYQGNCVLSYGFWKTHTDVWPVTSLQLGCTNNVLNQTQLLAILNTSPQGRATYILARQLIAALLNIQLGACANSEVTTCIATSQSLLCSWPLSSNPPTSVRNQMTAASDCLDRFNNGEKGNHKCDDDALNHPPVAMDDMATTYKNTPVTFQLLANDTDADNDDLDLLTITDPASGTVDVNSNGSVTYRPATNFVGADSFTYSIADGNGGFASAVVIVFVQPTAPAPPGGTCTEDIESCVARSTVFFTSSGASQYATFDGALTLSEGDLAPDFRSGSSATGTLKVTFGGSSPLVAFNSGIKYTVADTNATDNSEAWQYTASSTQKVTFLWKESQAYDANRDVHLPTNLGKLYTKFIHTDETRLRFEWTSSTRKPLIIAIDGIVLLTRNSSGAVSSTLPYSTGSSWIEVVYPDRMIPGNTISWYADSTASDGLQNLVYTHQASADGNSAATYFNAGGQFSITVPVNGLSYNASSSMRKATVEFQIGKQNVTLVGCSSFNVPSYSASCNNWSYNDE